jgi:hypothetical protein
MALTVEYNDIWKWLSSDWSVVFDVYWKMFDPNLPSVPSWDYTVHNQTTSFNLSWFQPWLEVSLWLITVANHTSSTIEWVWYCYMQQKIWGSWVTASSSEVYLWWFDLPWEDGWEYRMRSFWVWMWVDPDEYRPWITQYRYRWDLWNETFYSNTITISNLSFDTTSHPAWYLWVEWSNLCYVPPSIYSGSSNTWYKHMIQPDPWYSWSSWETPWYIRIPSSSSDHHIYYVNEYGIVSRTKESYDWSGGSSSAWSSKKWAIRMTPSTSSRPEQAWYNYLCYVDWGGYKRRMGVWEI